MMAQAILFYALRMYLALSGSPPYAHSEERSEPSAGLIFHESVITSHTFAKDWSRTSSLLLIEEKHDNGKI